MNAQAVGKRKRRLLIGATGLLGEMIRGAFFLSSAGTASSSAHGIQRVVDTALGTRHLIITTFTASFTTRHETIA